MDKKYLIFMFILLALPLVLGYSYQANIPQNVIFTCNIEGSLPTNAATFNFSIQNPDKTSFIFNQQATNLAQGTFNYTITFPQVGDYPVQLYCFDSSGNSSSDTVIHVTSTGRDNSLIFLIIIFFLACFFLILTMFVNEELFVYISGVLFIIIGIYTMIYGLEDLSDWYTRAIAYITLGLGFIFTLGAYLFNSYSLRQDKEDEYEETFD